LDDHEQTDIGKSETIRQRCMVMQLMCFALGLKMKKTWVCGPD